MNTRKRSNVIKNNIILCDRTSLHTCNEGRLQVTTSLLACTRSFHICNVHCKMMQSHCSCAMNLRLLHSHFKSSAITHHSTDTAYYKLVTTRLLPATPSNTLYSLHSLPATNVANLQ